MKKENPGRLRNLQPQFTMDPEWERSLLRTQKVSEFGPAKFGDLAVGEEFQIVFLKPGLPKSERLRKKSETTAISVGDNASVTCVDPRAEVVR